MSNLNKYFCIHGHFYQPPRENPWLGIIEPQSGAAPFRDWNERIAAECYTACTRARIHNRERCIERLANNFLNMSFNIGPTLFSWLASHHPHTAKRIISADRKSCERLAGHGNAIAQVYNHLIMPLASERDKHTQIIWGLADFAKRFGRSAEGIWLAECAVDNDTVRTLIDHKVKFIILSPKQASKVRALGENTWHKVNAGDLDTKHPYRVYERNSWGNREYSRYLDVFFYNETISHGIAFQNLLRNADKLLAKFSKFAGQEETAQFVCAATDGESYGHHEPYGEMCLAYFYEELLAKGNGKIANPAYFLNITVPTHEVELSFGISGTGSSWSCEHGVDRWFRDCGCSTGGKKEWNQKWRKPLRESLDKLRKQLDQIFEHEGCKYFTDPWEARQDYISVLLDHSEKNCKRFLKTFAPETLQDIQAAKRVWMLLEMQHNAMLMYTSCAWFFADLAGVEPIQNLRYALRALDYAKHFSQQNLEKDFINNLEKAKSNQREQISGSAIYRKLVKTSVYSEKQIAATYAMLKMYDLPDPAFSYTVNFINSKSAEIGNLRVFKGQLLLENHWLHTESRYAFISAHISDREAACVVKLCKTEKEAVDFLGEGQDFNPQEIILRLRSEGFLLRNLPPEQRSQLLNHILAEKLAEVEQGFSKDYDNMRPLLSTLAENNIEPPQILKVAAQFVLSERFKAICKQIAHRRQWDENAAFQAREIIKEAEIYKLQIERSAAAPIISELVLSYLDRLAEKLELSALEEVTALMHFAQEMGFFFENGGKIENRYWYILRRQVVPFLQKERSGKSELSEEEQTDQDELCQKVYQLGRELNFSVSHLEDLLNFVTHTEPDEGEL